MNQQQLLFIAMENTYKPTKLLTPQSIKWSTYREVLETLKRYQPKDGTPVQ